MSHLRLTHCQARDVCPRLIVNASRKRNLLRRVANIRQSSQRSMRWIIGDWIAYAPIVLKVLPVLLPYR